VGLAGGLLMQEPAPPDLEASSFSSDLRALFRWDTLKRSTGLLLLLANMCIGATGVYTDTPYLIIYLENAIGLSKTQFGLIGGVMLAGGAILAVPFGMLADRVNKRTIILAGALVSAAGAVAFSFSKSMLPLALSALVWKAFWMAGLIAAGAWLKDLLPPGSAGRFMTLRTLFVVALPMILGPLLGSSLIKLTSAADQAPTPIIFQADALLTALAIVPLLFVKHED
jgi:MFS family permease